MAEKGAELPNLVVKKPEPDKVWIGFGGKPQSSRILRQAERVVAQHIRNREHKKNSIQSEIPDDYIHRKDKVLMPLAVDASGIELSETRLQEIHEEFDYIAHTRDLEIGTERVSLLQTIVNHMTANRGVTARVVIMNRGRNPDAFVMPDGTVFISQSMINALDTLDEVGHVLAHEVNHILHKTWKTKNMAAKIGQSFGIAWSHELAADFTQDLMQDADLNSFYGAFATEKLAPSRRDEIHQTGVTRATISTAAHRAVHSRTSTKITTPIPSELHSQTAVVSTNNELMWRWASTGENAQGLINIVPRLHPHDLTELFKYNRVDNEDWLRDAHNAIINTLTIRLFREGISRAGIHALFYRIGQYNLLQDVVTDDTSFMRVIEVFDSPLQDEVKRANEIAFGRTAAFNEDHVISNLIYRASEFYTLYGSQMPNDVRDDHVIELVSRLERLKQEKLPQYLWMGMFSRQPIDVLVANIRAHYLHPPQDDRIDALFRGLHEKKVPLDTVYTIGRIKQLASEGIEDQNAIIVTQEDCERIERALKPYLPDEEPPIIDPDKFIENFFTGFQKKIDTSLQESWESYTELLSALQVQFYLRNAPDHDRLRYLEVLRDRISTLQPPAGSDVSQPNGEIYHATRENIRFVRFGLQAWAGVCLFSSDGDEFYSYLRQSMKDSGINPLDLPYAQRLALVSPLLNSTQTFMRDRKNGLGDLREWHLVIKNLDKLEELPFVRAALAFPSPRETDTHSLLQATDPNLLERDWMYLFRSEPSEDQRRIFIDDMPRLLEARAERKTMLSLLGGQIHPADYAALREYVISRLPLGPEQSQVVRGISKAIVRSSDLPWDYRVEFLVSHVGDYSFADVDALASEIHDMPTFVAFRQQLERAQEQVLSGGVESIRLAIADNAISYLLKNPSLVLDSMDAANATELSTDIAKIWFRGLLVTGWGERKRFDPNLHKVLLSGDRIVMSFADIVSTMKQLTTDERLGIVLKSLTDTNGLLMSVEGRKRLADTAIRVTNATGFSADVLRAACMEADAKYIAFPIAQMIAPALFKAYSTKDVSIDDLAELKIEQIIPGDEFGLMHVPLKDIVGAKSIPVLLNMSTRELISLGASYLDYPDTQFAMLASECEADYRTAVNRLQALFPEKTGPFQIESGQERLIRGVEAIGAPATRGLQLATQLLDLDPETEERFSQAADANPGLSTYLFWENLYRHSRNDTRLSQFLTEHNFILGEYIGGGSLYTTFRGQITIQGVQKKVAIRMRNPNAETFVTETHKEALKIFTRVAADHPEHRNMTEIAVDTADLSKEWCLRDIHDPEFMDDDQVFRRAMAGFVSGDPKTHIFVPEVYFNSDEMKVEELAEGRTANQILRDSSVSQDIKSRLVKTLCSVYEFQIDKRMKPANTDLYHIHSDPQLGNYVVHIVGEEIYIGIIDRNLYLKTTERTLTPFRHLVKSQKAHFVSEFLNLVFDVNNVKNPMERIKFLQQVLRDSASSIVRQEQQQSELETMHALMRSIRRQRYTVPLWMRLMLRNITMNDRLKKRFS